MSPFEWIASVVLITSALLLLGAALAGLVGAVQRRNTKPGRHRADERPADDFDRHVDQALAIAAPDTGSTS